MILLPIGGLFFGKYIKHPKNVTYIFQVGKSDLVILYSNHPKNVTYIFEVYLYKFDL
jgi:hypothetical protein